MSPTSEKLAAHLHDWFIERVEPRIPGRLVTVRVCETDSTWAQYTPERRG